MVKKLPARRKNTDECYWILLICSYHERKTETVENNSSTALVSIWPKLKLIWISNHRLQYSNWFIFPFLVTLLHLNLHNSTTCDKVRSRTLVFYCESTRREMTRYSICTALFLSSASPRNTFKLKTVFDSPINFLHVQTKSQIINKQKINVVMSPT